MESLKLGGNIELVGFNDMDKPSMVILKKIVGNYARKMSELANKFEMLSLAMKIVHDTGASRKFEIHAKLVADGKPFTSEAADRNVFVAIDDSLKNIVNSIRA